MRRLVRKVSILLVIWAAAPAAARADVGRSLECWSPERANRSDQATPFDDEDPAEPPAASPGRADDPDLEWQDEDIPDRSSSPLDHDDDEEAQA